jgi:thioredoxin reductase (NADPH)
MSDPDPKTSVETHEVIVVGGGLAGLSAALYLGRAERDTLVLDTGRSMARWEPDVENYLGFPDGIAGDELLRRGREQVRRYGVEILNDEITDGRKEGEFFHLKGRNQIYVGQRVLLATGIFHRPPDLEGLDECLGHSIFFCKDCDGIRNQGKTILIYGWTDEAAEYALAMLHYSPIVGIVLDGREPRWDRKHDGWLREYQIPLYNDRVTSIDREESQIRALRFENGTEVKLNALFAIRGDVYFNTLARMLGARVDDDGQIHVDHCMATTVKGVFAAGCVTPANCQMIIAAGQGATAGQAINRELFIESLERGTLKCFRARQLRSIQTQPETHPTQP